MKFCSVFVTLLLVFASSKVALAQICPTDNAFLSGQKIGLINPSRMETLAGLAVSRINPGVIWAHDSGKIDHVFALSTDTQPIDDYTLNHKLTDAEDIAVGPGPTTANAYLYLADSGGVRSSIVIARFLEPAVDLDPHTPDVFPFSDQTYFVLNYPDGLHDASGLMVDPISNDLFVVTYEETNARVYRAPQSILGTADATMTLVASVPIASVTAADISADGTQIAMRSTDVGMRWIRRSGETVAQALARDPHLIPILGTIEVNGDSLAFAPDGNGYYTTSQAQNPPLLFFARNTTRYTAGVGIATFNDDTMIEISGIAASRQNPGLAWIHNDGPQTQLYLISTNGLTFGLFQFSQSTSDFEDIAIGPGPVQGVDYVYCADIGDNATNRTEVRILRFPEPRVTTPSTATFSAGETVISMTYPDGPHDAEALMIDPITGDLFIATKESSGFHLYKATQAQLNTTGAVQLTHLLNGNFGPVSGGDISPDGTQIVLRHENEARLWHRRTGESIEAALTRTPEKVPVIGTPLEPNGEAISFAPDSKSYYTMSEGLFPTLYFFTPLAQPSFIGPPQVTNSGIRVVVSGCDDSRIRIETSDDLTNWTIEGYGNTINGVANIDVTDITNGTTFYRALVAGP